MSPDFTDDYAKEKAEYEKACAQHRRSFKKQRRLLEDHRKIIKELKDDEAKFANIGRETALGLFPEMRKKQG